MTFNISEEIANEIIKDYDKPKYHDLELYYGVNNNNSGLAKTVLKNKYFAPWETSLIDMWVRIAWAVAQAEKDENRMYWAKQFFSILADFKFIPGGRINYGMGRTDVIVSYSNCYVIPILEDSLDGIYNCLIEEAKTYKSGGGCGHDLDILRPEDSPIVGSGGKSCGPVGFMNLFSVSTETVQQQSRRGANMQTMSVNYPDIEKFIGVKNDAHWVQSAFKKISKLYPATSKILKEINEKFIDRRRNVQQSNISTKVLDSFMNAMVNDDKYDLTWGGKVYKTVKAKDIWGKIIKNAWQSGEPGIIFWDRMVETNNLQYCSPILSTNPCIVGDTLIAVADGRNAVSIKQLMEEGKDVPVYSTNLTTGQVEIKMARNARITGHDKEVLKLTLDDGSTFIATPNHKVLLKSLEYKEMKDLQPGDAIFPFNSFDSNKYRQIPNTGSKMIGGRFRNRRQYRLIHEFNSNLIVDAKTYAIHHKNFNSYDDSYNNLQIMSHEEHKELHAAKMRGKNNPYFKASQEWRDMFRQKAIHYGSKNGRYFNVSNEELIELGRKLYLKHGKITKRLWSEYAKQNKLPAYITSTCRFGKWSNFASLVINNHKVASVEPYGKQDVYNISVDDNHNYHIITSTNDNKYITSSGICIKNCSELPLAAYGNCLLGHINLARFATEDGEFLHDDYKRTIGIAQRFLDNIITLGADRHPLKEQTENALGERRTGLGITGLGDMLILMKKKYGSPQSIEFVSSIMQTFRDTAYETSCNLAIEKGSYPWFNADGFFESKFAQRLPEHIQNMIRTTGIRNGMLLTCAPVGSGSIISEVSSGIEPIFRKNFTRKVKNNKGDYDKYMIYHPLIKSLFVDKGLDIPDYIVDSSEIAPLERVTMQAAIQYYIDNSISSTVNLPADATEEQVSEIYYQAWKLGCKGITVYREGSREGILISDSTENKISQELDLDFVELDDNNKRRYTLKRPKKLVGETYKIRTDTGNDDGPINCYYTVNFFPNSDVPYELLITEPPGDKDIKDFLMLELATRCTSMMLRHRIPLKFIVGQFEKIKNQYIYSVPLNVAKVLRNYLTEEEMAELDNVNEKPEPINEPIQETVKKIVQNDKSEPSMGTKKCPECGGTIKFENGCFLCMDCGNGKCG